MKLQHQFFFPVLKQNFNKLIGPYTYKQKTSMA